MPTRHHRTVRLPFHAYDGGLYFVTVCTWGRQPLFGAVVDGEMVRSAAGDIAHAEWLRTAEVRPSVVLDAFVLMPDHVHLLFGIVGDDSHRGDVDEPPDTDLRTDTPAVCPYPADSPRHTGVFHHADTPCHGGRRFGHAVAGTVAPIMRQYKSVVTKRIRRIDPTVRVWQPRYHARVVRTDREADALRRYVHDNPARWAHRPDHAGGHRI
ncbi:transposase [Rubrivirga sp. IMCC45206]|uniref:transposase n=1 Tax=Rubrivirga sp. IMCC45206 TaxID=3391614 RepID=UPI00398F984D